MQLIEAGLGVSILPSSLERQYVHLNVSFIQLIDMPISTEVVLAYRSQANAALDWFIKEYS